MPQIAYLNGGQRQMAILSISQMIQDGAVKIEELKRSRWLNPKPPCLRSQAPLSAYADDVSQLIYQEASQPQGLNVYSLRQILEPRGNRIKETLEDLQLLNRNRLNMQAGLPMFVVIATAFAKLIWVFGTHRPVGFLIMGTVIAFVTSVLLIYQRRLTTAGTRYLQRMKQSSHHLQFFNKATYGGLAPADMAMSIAMFGLMDSTSPELTAFHSAIAHSNSSRGCGSSCGSSCGGGGGCGGGGCGGCGGGS